jgi:UDP:flavonoid glycosyltransferase YjiC (YdhE family)
MRIAVVCNDTRGGIQPYVALGLGLRAAGHEVRAMAPSELAPMFTDVGIPAAPLSGDPELMRQGTAMAEKGMIASMRFAARELPNILATWTRETLEACEGADVLTGGVGGMGMGLSVAEKLGKPFIETHLQPVGAPTDAYPGVLFPGVPRWLGGFGRRMSHHLSEMAFWMPFKGAMMAAREKVLGLSGRPIAADGQPVMYGFSRHVLEVPAGRERARHVTGYWTLPAGPTWRPPSALEAFLDRGGPVVSIGFGSMASSDPKALTALVVGAVRRAGVRAVLLAGWGGLTSIPDASDVFCADALPHDWLFPRVAAVGHHGGAGTTGAALRAGVPAVVVPFTMDQPFWGSRVAALGVGPAPIPRARLTEERLADALRRAVTDEAMRGRASDLGALIRAEDGVANAVEHFNRLPVAPVRARVGRNANGPEA